MSSPRQVEGDRTASPTPRGPARKVAHLSPGERVARGKAARNDTPRSSHARWAPATNRPDPVTLLEEQGASRVPELVPLRYGRMMVSPFTFYRGGALIMASDLAATPRSGLTAQICGDAHLSNFGVFASPERQMMFDINDFDETLPGPWEWDVKRLAASFEIACRDRGFKPADRRAVVVAGVAEYRARMHQFAAARNLDVWYAHIPVDRIFEELKATATKKQQAKAKANAAKARTRDSMQAFTKLTHVVDGQRRIVSDPPLIVPIEELVPAGSGRDDIEAEVRDLIRSYRRSLETDRRELLETFEYVHLARKVVGVGSVGTRAFIVLLEGRDMKDPLFLQVKEATRSVLEDHLPASKFANPGERVVRGQRMMQATSDIFLGWTKGVQANRFYYWRQLRDMKTSAVIESMTPAALSFYADLCGWTLARAHARSGDVIAMASYLGDADTFETAITDFAVRYADQNELDYQAFTAAIDSGRLPVQRGL